MKIFTLLLLLAIAIHGIAQDSRTAKNRIPKADPSFAISSPTQVRAKRSGELPNHPTSSFKNKTITCKLIEVKNNTYGYNIFINDRLFIHQPVIPRLSGNTGFKTRTEAMKVATLVINKIQKGLIPPAVSTLEMQNLGIHLR